MFVILKLLALTKGVNRVGHDPKTVIFSSSRYKVTKQKKSFLSTGFILNIQILCYHLSYYVVKLNQRNLPVKILIFKINCKILPLSPMLKLKVVELSQILVAVKPKP